MAPQHSLEAFFGNSPWLHGQQGGREGNDNPSSLGMTCRHYTVSFRGCWLSRLGLSKRMNSYPIYHDAGFHLRLWWLQSQILFIITSTSQYKYTVFSISQLVGLIMMVFLLSVEQYQLLSGLTCGYMDLITVDDSQNEVKWPSIKINQAMLIFCPSWFCTLTYYIIRFISLCKIFTYLSF